jgi:hypothetical protein
MPEKPAFSIAAQGPVEGKTGATAASLSRLWSRVVYSHHVALLVIGLHGLMSPHGALASLRGRRTTAP